MWIPLFSGAMKVSKHALESQESQRYILFQRLKTDPRKCFMEKYCNLVLKHQIICRRELYGDPKHN